METVVNSKVEWQARQLAKTDVIGMNLSLALLVMVMTGIEGTTNASFLTLWDMYWTQLVLPLVSTIIERQLTVVGPQVCFQISNFSQSLSLFMRGFSPNPFVWAIWLYKFCPGGCTSTFSTIPNTQGNGGLFQNGIYSQLLCQNRCLQPLSGQTCYAYDFRTNSRQCYIYLSSNYQNGNSGGSFGSTLYKRNCPGRLTKVMN